MNEPDGYEVLTTIFREIFVRDDLVLEPKTKLADIPDWNSHKQVEVVIAIEDYYAIELSTSELDKCDTVEKLANLVASLITAQRKPVDRTP